jgi:hypothetical protein
MQNETQPLEANIMTQFFYSRSKPGGVVILTDRPELAEYQYPKETEVYIACNPIKLFHHKYKRKKLGDPHTNTKYISTSRLNKRFLKNKFLVVIDYLEKPSVSLIGKLHLNYLSKLPLMSIVGVKKNKTWTKARLRTYLSSNPDLLVGETRRLASSGSKDELVALGGQLINVSRRPVRPTVSVLAVVAIYNEEDIIAATIKHLLDQGTDVHIIDNWSNDGSYEIIKALAENSSRISYERFPEKPSNKFELEKILNRVTDIAKAKPEYDWIMLNDADEFRWSPWKGVTIQEAFSFLDSSGYNSVDYTVFNLSPTEEGFAQNNNPLTFFQYGQFSGMEGHFVQVKSWKNIPGADLASSGGHHVTFANQKIFPLKFLLAHYPIRSSEHGRRKIFRQRKSRFSPEEREKNWHRQYDSENDETRSFLEDKKSLINYGAKDFSEEYILERLGGIGIKRD